jgi:xanthine dehydrogenase accessory factor
MWIEKRKLLELWDAAERAGEEVALATIVRVDGSSYREPGATMLLTRSGVRAGMVSGGCLEGEVAKKIWWLTESGPCVEAYTTSFDDDGEGGHGLGCGGRISLLLERGASATGRVEAIRRSVVERAASAVATVIVAGALPVGARVVLCEGQAGLEAVGCQRGEGDSMPRAEVDGVLPDGVSVSALEDAARRVLEVRCSHLVDLGDGQAAFVEWVGPPPSLFVFGAGDDARPVAALAAAMGWEVTVADGRSHLATSLRFPGAQLVVVLGESAWAELQIGEDAAAVLMTHSYQQDREILAAILPLNLKYVGVLGPRRRTSELIGDIAEELPGGRTAEEWLERLHSPAGLDLGSDGPEVVALSIIAEVQATLEGRAAKPLRVLRPALIAADD